MKNTTDANVHNSTDCLYLVAQTFVVFTAVFIAFLCPLTRVYDVTKTTTM